LRAQRDETKQVFEATPPTHTYTYTITHLHLYLYAYELVYDTHKHTHTNTIRRVRRVWSSRNSLDFNFCNCDSHHHFT